MSGESARGGPGEPVDVGWDDPRLDDYRALRERDLRSTHQGAGAFIAEGKLVVERLVASRYRVRSVLVRADRVAALAPTLARLPAGTPVLRASEELFARLPGVRFHQGALAAGEEGPPRAPAEVLERATRVVVLAGVGNHDNVGGVFRNVAALAGSGGAVLLDPRTSDPLYRKAIRVSMGWALHVPFARLTPFPDGLEELRARGFRLLALSPREDARDLARLARPLPPRAALLLGSEGDGLDAAAMARADEVVRIPLARGVDSLNLSVACALALYALGPPSAAPGSAGG